MKVLLNLLDRQQKSSDILAAALDKMASNNGGRVPISALGVNPGLLLKFEGDRYSIDLNKIKITMVSGKNSTSDGVVIRQHLWPHRAVSKASAHLLLQGKKLDHWGQSFPQFYEGMCQKILIETESLDPIIKNKLRFQSYLILRDG